LKANIDLAAKKGAPVEKSTCLQDAISLEKGVVTIKSTGKDSGGPQVEEKIGQKKEFEVGGLKDQNGA